MKVLCDDKGEMHAVVLDKKEARAFYTALLHATEPEPGAKLSKRSSAWKIAHEIADTLSIW